MDKDNESPREEYPDNVVHVDFGSSRPKVVENSHEQSDEIVQFIGHIDDEPQGEVTGFDAANLLAVRKFRTFSDFIEDGMVMVMLDTRIPGVNVPEQFAGMPDLRLNFSHQFHIDDFVYDEFAVSATLSFQGKFHRCVIPWDAVKMLYNHAKETVAVF